MSTPSQPLAVLLEGLSPAQVQEFVDAADYLAEHTQNGGKVPKEGSVSHVLATLSPEVRARFQMLNEALGTPRNAPFQDKLSESQIADAMGLDSFSTEAINSAFDTDQVAAGLQARMGTDANAPPPPVSMRDQVAAAYEAALRGQGATS